MTTDRDLALAEHRRRARAEAWGLAAQAVAGLLFAAVFVAAFWGAGA